VARKDLRREVGPVDRGERDIQARERGGRVFYAVDVVIVEVLARDAPKERGRTRGVDFHGKRVAGLGRDRHRGPEAQLRGGNSPQQLMLEPDRLGTLLRVQPEHVLAGFATDEPGLIADPPARAGELAGPRYGPLVEEL